MTEAVCLALITLVGLLVFFIGLIILVKIILHKAPTYFKISTKYGACEISFNSKVIDK